MTSGTVTIDQFRDWMKLFMEAPECPEDKLIPVATWRIDLWKWEAKFSSPTTRRSPCGNSRQRRRTRRVQNAYWKHGEDFYKRMNFI